MLSVCIIGLLAFSGLGGAIRPVAAVSTTVVISQFQVAGGSAADEFVELHNVGSGAVDLNGYTLAYRSAAGTNDILLASWSVSTVIPAGGYYLVGAAPGYDGTPAADATYGDGGSGRFSGSSGSLALRSGAANTGTVVDSVGYGSATNVFVEGATTAAPATNGSAARKDNGCTDSDNNANDFAALATAAPRNSATPVVVCGADNPPTVTGTTPANGAANVAPGSNIAVTFSEAVTLTDQAGNRPFTITCGTTEQTYSLTGSGTTFTLDPAATLPDGPCSVTVRATNVADQDGTPDQPTADVTFSFSVTTPVAGTTRIRDIQGAAHLSPLVNTGVTNVPGVVTATRANGFYLQDPTPDADPKTSEGIFVFTSSAPPVQAAVGNAVLVSGTVSEFRPGGANGTSLTITQIGGTPTVTLQTVGAAIPAATVIGAGGRVPPTTVIDNDATGSPPSVENGGPFDPEQDGIDFYESLEGMHVQVNNAFAVGPTSQFGSGAGANNEIPVLADGGAGAGPRTARGGIVVQPGDFNPERIILNDSLTGVDLLPVVNVGDGLGTITGVIDYAFNNFKLQVLALPARADNGLPREVTGIETAPNSLTVATFNVENLDPGDDPAKYTALAGVVLTNLKAPDIIALEEIQDNNGPTNDGVVDASQTFQQLIDAIAAAGGPTYEFRQIDPADDQDGGEPGGNIRVGFLFRTDRGVSFVDRPGGTATTAVGVTGTGTGTQLTVSPGRIDPTNGAFADSRKPLAGEFRFNGQTVFVVANHFNSKGGDQPLFGRYQPPTLTSEAQRRQQAQIVHDFVRQVLTADPNANVVVLGDLNDFQFSAPLGILEGTNPQLLYTLLDLLPTEEQYTYVFQGNSQALDHIMVSGNLFANAAVAYDVVHVNAEFGDQISDHDPQVARFTLAPPSPAAPTVGDLSVATRQDTAITIVLDGTAASGGALTYRIVTPPARGTLGPIVGDRVTYTPAPGYDGPDSFTYAVSENGVESKVATVTITIAPPTTPIYTLTAAMSGSGSVTPEGGTYAAGQSATVAATPAPGNLFIGWTVDGVFAGFANPLTITMGANHSVVAAFAPASAFADVSSGTPYNEAILRLAARGIIRGFEDGTFGPTQTVNRAQSAALIARAMGWDADDRGNPFSDRCEPLDPANCVDPDLWRNVGTLAFYDVARGYPTGEYRPRDGVAHIQVISFITRAMVAKGYWIQATADDPNLYPNVPTESGHRLDLVTFVAYAGAIPDRPANQAWADWDTAASRGWYAQLLDLALRSRFATTP